MSLIAADSSWSTGKNEVNEAAEELKKKEDSVWKAALAPYLHFINSEHDEVKPHGTYTLFVDGVVIGWLLVVGWCALSVLRMIGCWGDALYRVNRHESKPVLVEFCERLNKELESAFGPKAKTILPPKNKAKQDYHDTMRTALVTLLTDVKNDRNVCNFTSLCN